ncbi:MAG: prepilin-type N-terminal cleavage/methylation domain-containing protein [Betaproteobacteria bacterium]|nr:prepilin-type N-terminal cleavage/methylation domain-containing protein [Betaproteobacteria bacterium]
MCSRAGGFTLIEMMVALLLLAVMSMMSWRALDSMVRTREALAYRGHQFDGIRTLFAQWENDCHELGSPDTWLVGVPLHFQENRIDLIRNRVDGNGARHAVLVSYRWTEGRVERVESPPVLTRAELLQNWNAMGKGTALDSLYSLVPVQLMSQSTGIAARGFMEGADWSADSAQINQQWLTPGQAGNPLLLGLELTVGVTEGGAPMREVCLTGQS